MIKLPLYNMSGEKLQDVEVNSGVFGVEPKIALLEEAVRVQLANKRRVISSTKTRDEVRGGGRKPWQQKGTGRARHGSIRSPLWAGGGITFGPRPGRNWSLKMNKKASKKALLMAISDKVKAGAVIIVEALSSSDSKANAFAKNIKTLLSKAEMPTRRSLVVISAKDENLTKASKNLTDIKLATASSINVYDVLNATTMVVTKDALAVIEKTFVK